MNFQSEFQRTLKLKLLLLRAYAILYGNNSGFHGTSWDFSGFFLEKCTGLFESDLPLGAAPGENSGDHRTTTMWAGDDTTMWQKRDKGWGNYAAVSTMRRLSSHLLPLSGQSLMCSMAYDVIIPPLVPPDDANIKTLFYKNHTYLWKRLQILNIRYSFRGLGYS